MNRTSSLLLVAVCAVLLGGAWVASRALTADVSAPATATPAAALPQPVAPPARAEPSPAARPLPALVREQPPGEPPRLVLPDEPKLPAADPDSDYADENSPAIQQEWRSAFSGKAGLPEWTHAVKIFKRCLVQAPANQRCREGLAAVEAHLKALPQQPSAPADVVPPRPGPSGHHDNLSDEE